MTCTYTGKPIGKRGRPMPIFPPYHEKPPVDTTTTAPTAAPTTTTTTTNNNASNTNLIDAYNNSSNNSNTTPNDMAYTSSKVSAQSTKGNVYSSDSPLSSNTPRSATTITSPRTGMIYCIYHIIVFCWSCSTVLTI